MDTFIFKNWLRSAREAKGWTMKELGEKVHLSTGHINHLEKGHRDPTDESLGKLAPVLDVDHQWLLDRVDEERQSKKRVERLVRRYTQIQSDRLVNEAVDILLYEGMRASTAEDRQNVARMLEVALAPETIVSGDEDGPQDVDELIAILQNLPSERGTGLTAQVGNERAHFKLPAELPITTAAKVPSPVKRQKTEVAGLTQLAEYLLRKKAEYKGMGYRDFARFMQIDERTLADILAGYIPPQKTLRKMAHYLGEEPSVLFDLTKPAQRAPLTLRDALHELLVNHVELPYYGQVGCGRMLELGDHPEGMRSIPAYMLEGEDIEKVSLVEATGDSMLNAGIWPGVTLVVRRQDHAKDGQVVIANIPHAGTTCKRLKVKRDGKWLVSESPTPYEPIRVEDGVRIVGRVLHTWHERSFA